MTEKPSVHHFLRRFLLGWLEKLDRIEKTSPRSHKTRWYQIDYHIPPMLVAILTSIIFWAVMCWGSDYNVYQYSAYAVFVILVVSLSSIYLSVHHPDIAKSDDATSLLAVLFLVSLLWIKLGAFLAVKFTIISPYATPVTIAPLLATLLLHPRVAVVLAFVVSFIFGFENGYSLNIALLSAIGGTTMVAVVARARTAHYVARAGLLVGLVQVLIVLFIAITMAWDHQRTWIGMISAFFSGILAAFFSLGALPYLESFFSRVSNLKLLELADVNHPLLRKMSIEAPGTYHHSMIVANLASDAAGAVGANVLLTRAGAYFHDIGKMVKSEYFIENQGTYGNPHDQVAPSLSKLVITSHVKEGIALGKAYNLDQQILNFIPQHHGTSQIEYFYQKALKLEEVEEEEDKEDVSEETYRYPGPKPQTREAGIVMLADSCEAASRTLEEPNHQRYKDLVYKIINKKLFDGQLDETPLTLKDLRTIGDRFTATLISINHSRIPYPETGDSGDQEKDQLAPPK